MQTTLGRNWGGNQAPNAMGGKHPMVRGLASGGDWWGGSEKGEWCAGLWRVKTVFVFATLPKFYCSLGGESGNEIIDFGGKCKKAPFCAPLPCCNAPKHIATSFRANITKNLWGFPSKSQLKAAKYSQNLKSSRSKTSPTKSKQTWKQCTIKHQIKQKKFTCFQIDSAPQVDSKTIYLCSLRNGVLSHARLETSLFFSFGHLGELTSKR